MPRPPRPPRREEVPEEERGLWDQVVRHYNPDGDVDRVGDWVGALLWWPAYARNRVTRRGWWYTIASVSA